MKNVQAIVKRLRKAKAIEDSEGFTIGKNAGIEWASKDAGPSELARLERFSNENPDASSGDETSLAYDVFQAITLDRSEYYAEFWEGILHEDELGKDAVVKGFVAGALEVWDEVKAQI